MAETESGSMDDEFRGRCTPEQKRRWERAARSAKRSLSDWIRLVCDDAAALAEKDPGLAAPNLQATIERAIGDILRDPDASLNMTLGQLLIRERTPQQEEKPAESKKPKRK